jgi:hypothetical protein
MTYMIAMTTHKSTHWLRFKHCLLNQERFCEYYPLLRNIIQLNSLKKGTIPAKKIGYSTTDLSNWMLHTYNTLSLSRRFVKMLLIKRCNRLTGWRNNVIQTRFCLMQSIKRWMINKFTIKLFSFYLFYIHH